MARSDGSRRSGVRIVTLAGALRNADSVVWGRVSEECESLLDSGSFLASAFGGSRHLVILAENSHRWCVEIVELAAANAVETTKKSGGTEA